MRLTKKDKQENHYFVKPINKNVAFDFEARIKADDKLGKLEDWEEKFGIDLITLFKALENGYFIEWFFEDKRYIREISGGCLKCFRKEKISDYPDKHIWGLSIGNTVNYKLSDYGKTWALTKEELKDEQRIRSIR